MLHNWTHLVRRPRRKAIIDSGGPRPRLTAVLLLLALCSSCGPDTARQPAHFEIVELVGSPYERGHQHGRHFSSKIRSLYTQMLTSSLLPWLNREQPDLASLLVEYRKPLYDDGQFSYQVLLQSGQNLARTIPEPYLEEMQGVADGADLPFEQILVLNTFVETLLGLRSVSFLIRLMQAPQALGVEFLGGLESDGADNDGDGLIDEAAEGNLSPYDASPYASMVEVPVDARFRIIFQDPDGVDPDSVRIQLDQQVFEVGDPSLEMRKAPGNELHILFTPPEALEPASAVSLQFQAADLSLLTDPPPSHARVMRDERIVFTTVGYGEAPHQVPNKGGRDDRFQPPSIGFALRGSATVDGSVLAAHHFALLDSNTSHKHTALFIHRPERGRPHAVLGWTGIIWGFSGMNSDGLVYLANVADTLDNSVAGEFLDHLFWAKLLAGGVPIGIVGREVLANAGGVDQGLDILEDHQHSFGWNLILADRTGAMASAEIDSNILDDEDGGFYAFTPDAENPDNLDPWGRRWASAGRDDLRNDSHYVRNTEDIDLTILGIPLLQPQRCVSTFYFRSLRAFSILGELIEGSYGGLDRSKAIEIIRTPDLIDKRDSMNAVVFEPETLRLYFAMGEVPATDGPFIPLDLAAALEKGDRP